MRSEKRSGGVHMHPLMPFTCPIPICAYFCLSGSSAALRCCDLHGFEEEMGWISKTLMSDCDHRGMLD